MSEPTTATFSAGSLTALFVGLFGPLAGEYATIVFAALAGALWPLSSAKTATRLEGFWFVLRLVLTASVLTGGVAAYFESSWKYPAHVTLAPLAFFIGAFGNRWRDIIDSVFNAVRTIVNNFRSKGDPNANVPPSSADHL